MKGKIFEMLEKYINRRRISFSMPGHKNGKGIDGFWGDFDVTELEDTDSLHDSEGAVLAACGKIAGIFSADMSLIMVNGSTGGIFTMLASVTKPGDEVLVSRTSHMSVINACVVLGLSPVFFEHKICDEFSVAGGADIDDLKKKIDCGNIRAVLVTSPNYFGMVSDIKAISSIAKEKNIPLLVDEAHGAHFIAGDFLPESALSLGADMAVQSTHKTLNGLNQSAVLHVKAGLVDLERVKAVSVFFQTSSPSYPIAASAENAILEVAGNGEAWRAVLKRCRKLKESLREDTKIKMPDKKECFYDLDETRLTFNFSMYNVTGHEVSDILRLKYNIDAEMADGENIVLIATPANSAKDFDTLEEALKGICSGLERVEKRKKPCVLPGLDKPEILPTEAFYGEGEWIAIEESLGRISAVVVTVYPPGVPVLVPGALIEEKCIKYIMECGGRVTGMKDGKIKVMKKGGEC